MTPAKLMVFNSTDLEITGIIYAFTLFRSDPKTFKLIRMTCGDPAEHQPTIKVQPVAVESPAIYKFSDNEFLCSFLGEWVLYLTICMFSQE